MEVSASPNDVVVQTIWKAAWKTFLQAFVSGLALTFSPWLIDISNRLTSGENVSLSDANIGGKLILAAAVGAIAAVISFAMNFFVTRTLPSGSTVQANTNQGVKVIQP